ncbi:MAG: methyltransferase domain-containing protein [Gemmatimonadetes bacterium]|uniref:Methyltransferase domain-containing protein n=1 Tax=Candidatus Kutchimonas denitrificans TaxID=3056748 RepID=A0AAE5CC02_9BACT|nr:methyltransferase domain-containing protein [Gemmatimonadota bacterium]NIR75060.1 methyltransferase domain-containing protein [Candidatus Kutchimonas denitrificans]NIS02880.1 methyltransferase domain-containing protein [Gemmatimonadota bacterium]NIT68589.1 methyltransferase domain-containing protein [Gemmatimonadota bacterium]NIU52849.1 methyltransferase domain-containing protein [Gemmatimonadota bacterium]
MQPKLQRRVQRYGWDKASVHYDRYWARQIEPSQALLLEMAQLRPGDRVVDIACGTGLVTWPAAEAVGPDGLVVATDISDRMVELVNDEAERRGLGQVRGARMGAEELELDDDSFDATLNALGLMYVPDPVRALNEMRRVLRPGGRAAAAVWGRRDRCGWAEIFPIVDCRVETEVCPLFFQLGTGDALEYAFEAAGFDRITSRRISSSLHYEDEEEALGAAFVGGPVAMAYARFDDATREEAHAEYLESIEPYRNGSGYRIPGEFVVTLGFNEPASTPEDR